MAESAAPASPSPDNVGDHTKIAEYSKTDAALAELRKKFGAVVYDFARQGEMQRALKDRATVRGYRIDLEKMRKQLKEDVLVRGRLIDGEAHRIEGELRKIEDPIDGQIKNEERRKEEERLARERAEQERIADIQRRIAEIGELAANAVGLPSGDVAKVLDCARAVEISEETFGEFEASATAAKRKAVLTLDQLHAGALAQEEAAERERLRRVEDEARLAREREELERQRAADEERRRAESMRIAEENKRLAEARAKAEAEERTRREKVEAEERARREQIAREDAERQARIRAADEERRAKLESEERERRAAQEARDAEERKEREALAAWERDARERAAAEEARLDAERRELARRAAELEDGKTVLAKFKERFGKEKEFAGVVRAIDAYFAGSKQKKAAAA